MSDPVPSLVTSNLMNAVLIAELIPKLAELGVLSDNDTQDIYSRAYDELEEMRAEAEDADYRAACSEGCRIIGEALNTTPLNTDE